MSPTHKERRIETIPTNSRCHTEIFCNVFRYPSRRDTL